MPARNTLDSQHASPAQHHDFAGTLEQIATEIRPLFGQSQVADYLPHLAKVPADRFGMALDTLDGRVNSAGDARKAFAIQSITRVFIFNFALEALGDALWKRVGLPAKSGVGGGIVAIVPGVRSLAAWSPGLDEKGNSLVGAAAVDRFTAITGLSVF